MRVPGITAVVAMCLGGLLVAHPAQQAQAPPQQQYQQRGYDDGYFGNPPQDMRLAQECGRRYGIQVPDPSDLAARYRVGPGIIDRVCAEVARQPDRLEVGRLGILPAIGRGAVANGNGKAQLPPGPIAPVTIYRQPEPPRRTGAAVALRVRQERHRGYGAEQCGGQQGRGERGRGHVAAHRRWHALPLGRR